MKHSLKLYGRLLQRLKPYRKVIAFSMLAIFATAAFEPLIASMLKPLVDESLIKKNPEAIWQVPLMMMLLFLGKGIAEYATNVTGQWIANKTIADLRQEVFEHQMLLPVSSHQQEAAGRMLSRVTYDIPMVGDALSNAWIVVIKDTLTILGLFGFLFYTAWELTLAIFAVGPVVALVVRVASKRLRHTNRAMQESMGAMTGVVEESLAGLKEVKIFGSHAQQGARFHKVSERLRHETMRVVKIAALNVPLVQVLAASAVALVMYLASTLSAQDRLSPGEFFSFVTAMALIFEPIRRLTNTNTSIQRGLAGAQSVFEMLDTPTERDTGTQSLDKVRGQIDIDNLSFRYANQESGWALREFSLSIAPGETVALVGASGSGKTTLTALLTRFYDPTEGEIRLDGVALPDIQLKALRKQMALVGQSVVLFDGSIRDNIAYSRPDASEAQIIEAAKRAHAWEFIERHPEGLDLQIGHNGGRLSGGQRQRIAIARAFLKDAPILLLDEATSALDNESERVVREALIELRKNRTVIVIAHRLTTIRDAHRIIVMANGRIVESGKHASLAAADGPYARLLRSGEDVIEDI